MASHDGGSRIVSLTSMLLVPVALSCAVAAAAASAATTGKPNLLVLFADGVSGPAGVRAEMPRVGERGRA